MKCTRRNFLLVSIGLSAAATNLSANNQRSNLSKADLKTKTASNGMNIPLPKGPLSSEDLSRLLHCISLVETGNRDDAVGPGGERSRYQISRAVWKQHMHDFLVWEPDGKGNEILCPINFERHCKNANAWDCAERHILWLDSSLPGTGPFWLAFAWRAGLERTRQQIQESCISENLFDYAKRVTNLYNDPSLVVP